MHWHLCSARYCCYAHAERFNSVFSPQLQSIFLALPEPPTPPACPLPPVKPLVDLPVFILPISGLNPWLFGLRFPFPQRWLWIMFGLLVYDSTVSGYDLDTVNDFPSLDPKITWLPEFAYACCVEQDGQVSSLNSASGI